MARSPGAGPEGENIDIRFTGVREVSITTNFKIERVERIAEPVSGALTLFRISLMGPEGHGSVVAENVVFELNSRALFDGLPNAGAGTFEDAKRLELAVRSELITHFPEATVKSDRSNGPDFEIVIGDRRAFVEVIRANEDSVERQLRRLVMERVPRWDLSTVRSAPLVVVLGGLRPEVLATELLKHLSTSLNHSNIEAIVWNDFGPRTLARKIGAILFPRPREAASFFQVFKDASGTYRWRLKARNGHILATSDAYTSAGHARRAIEAVARAANAEIEAS